ncbi:hypothetical protein Glove_168g25 [Diversispora epigaea]|uniref:Uncharacterized protein n=1 Tax=Diversispora epigaea TaxID=1348612 RepID=A0A397IQ54_9GLOM|nr:hypothetical protein Glove_168g25 [Diversispora epigaea]
MANQMLKKRKFFDLKIGNLVQIKVPKVDWFSEREENLGLLHIPSLSPCNSSSCKCKKENNVIVVTVDNFMMMNFLENFLEVYYNEKQKVKEDELVVALWFIKSLEKKFEMIDQVTIVDVELIDDTMMIGNVVSIVVTEIIDAFTDVMVDDACCNGCHEMIDQVTIVDVELIDDTMMIGNVVSIVVTEIIDAFTDVMVDDACCNGCQGW